MQVSTWRRVVYNSTNLSRFTRRLHRLASLLQLPDQKAQLRLVRRERLAASGAAWRSQLKAYCGPARGRALHNALPVAPRSERQVHGPPRQHQRLLRAARRVRHAWRRCAGAGRTSCNVAATTAPRKRSRSLLYGLHTASACSARRARQRNRINLCCRRRCAPLGRPSCSSSFARTASSTSYLAAGRIKRVSSLSGPPHGAWPTRPRW